MNDLVRIYTRQLQFLEWWMSFACVLECSRNIAPMRVFLHFRSPASAHPKDLNFLARKTSSRLISSIANTWSDSENSSNNHHHGFNAGIFPIHLGNRMFGDLKIGPTCYRCNLHVTLWTFRAVLQSQCGFSDFEEILHIILRIKGVLYGSSLPHARDSIIRKTFSIFEVFKLQITSISWAIQREGAMRDCVTNLWGP